MRKLIVLRSIVLLLLPLLCAACSILPPEQELQTHLQAVSSWAATAQLASENWLHGDVPDGYMRDVLAMSQEEIHTEAADLVAAVKDAPNGPAITDNVNKIEKLVTDLAAAVERGDKDGTQQQSKLLGDAMGALQQLEAAPAQ